MARKPNTRLRRRGADKTGRGKGGGRYVKLEHYLLHSPAWRSLGLAARCLLIEIWQRHNGVNNGEISFSVREAAAKLGIHKDTASKAFHELEDKGFLRVRQRGSFNYKARHATEWEITAEPYRDKPASKDFMRWGATTEKQDTVLPKGTDGPTQRGRVIPGAAKNTRHGPNQSDRHPPNGPTHGPTEQDTSNIPGGFRGNGSDDKRNDADLLAIPECFDRRKRKLARRQQTKATQGLSEHH